MIAAITCSGTISHQYTTVGSDAPAYDGDGNLAGYNGRIYTYDAQNRLIDATGPHGDVEVVFAYDGRNRCVTRNAITTGGSHGGTLWTATNLFYDGWNVIEDQDSYNGLQASYVHGARTDERLTRDDGAGTLYERLETLYIKPSC